MGLFKKERIDQAQKNITSMICENLSFDAKEAYNLLRTNINFTLPDDGKGKVIGIASSERGEGKSTTSINLAYSISQNNKKVLLIDGDMRLPSIAAKLNLKAGKGLSDFIIGSVQANDVLFYTKYPNLDICLSGSIPPNPSELLGSERMKFIISKLATSYDYIIIDLPPVNVVSDALVIKNFVDGLIVVARQNYTLKRSIQNCMSSLQLIDAKVLGFVVNDASASQGYGSYSSKYNKYYSSRYGYGGYY